jgi:hypothetical protein
MTPAGNTATVYRVWIATDLGATGTLDIPKDQWTMDALPALLAARAQELDLAFMIAR